MPKQYTKTYKVDDYDVNLFQEVQVRRLIQWMNHTMACQNQDRPEDHLGQGVAWVFVEQELKVYRWPKFGESIHISTRPDRFNAMYGSRLFEIHDDKGEKIADNWALFCLMDLKTRTLERIPQKALQQFEAEWGKAGSGRPLKRSKWSALPAMDHSQLLSVGFTDLDSNGHVNNTAYIDWVMDSLPLDFHRQWQMRQLTIQYLKEVLPDQVIQVCHSPLIEGQEKGQGEMLFQLQSDQTTHATILVNWQKVEN